MSYRTPLNDIRFALKELADLKGVLALPAYEDVSEDLIDAVLDENARFVEQAIAPLNRNGDVLGATESNGAVTTSRGFKEAFHEFAQGGWQGLLHSVDRGGQGLPKLLGAATSENINAGCLAFALCPLLTDGVIEALAAVGDASQQALYIPRLIDGRWTGTMNLTEPQAGSDLAQISTRAVKQDDGSYRLFGQKIFITYGEHDMAENIVHLVLARTQDAPKGIKGISLFIVPKYLVNADGSLGSRNDVWCASLEHKLGIHGSPTAVLLYGSGKGEVGDGAVGHLIGQENRGLEYMFIMMNAARFAVGIQGVAVSERALQLATAYAHERVQGQAIDGSSTAVAIINHPDVQRMVLTMKSLTEGARALAYVAAAAADKARAYGDATLRAEQKALYEFLVPVVKGFSTEISVEVASLGIQVHGGMGYIEETGAAQYYRDARILPIYEGTTAIQANDFVGRKVLRDGGAVAASLCQAMRATIDALRTAERDGGLHGESLGMVATRLEAAVAAFEEATGFVLQHAATSPRAVFMGSVPYLMLAGVVLSGWQMARAALVSNSKLLSDETAGFYLGKLATAVFYAGHIVPRSIALGRSVLEGGLVSRYAALAVGT